MTPLLPVTSDHFRTHGQCFSAARRAISYDLHDGVLLIAEQMLGEGRTALRKLYRGLETGQVDAVRNAIGPGIREWRQAAGISQRQVATYVGIDAGNLSKFERTPDEPAKAIAPSLEAGLRAAVLLLLLADPQAPLGAEEVATEAGVLALPVFHPVATELRAAAQRLPEPSGNPDDLIAAELSRSEASPAVRRLVLVLLRRPHSAAELVAHLQGNELEDLRQALRNPSLEHLFDRLEQDIDAGAEGDRDLPGP